MNCHKLLHNLRVLHKPQVLQQVQKLPLEPVVLEFLAVFQVPPLLQLLEPMVLEFLAVFQVPPLLQLLELLVPQFLELLVLFLLLLHLLLLILLLL